MVAFPVSEVALRVATYNVHDCIGRDGRHCPARIASIIAGLGADIVAVQEITIDRAGAVRAALQGITGLTVIDGSLFDRGAGRYGNLLLTRLPLIEHVAVDLSVQGREPRGLLSARVRVGGRRVAVLATHLGLAAAERRQQIERLAGHAEACAGPLLLLGDLNVWQGPGPLVPLSASGLEGRRVATFPTWVRPVLALDRIMVRNPLRIRTCWRASNAETAIASDHYPLVADVLLEDEAGAWT